MSKEEWRAIPGYEGYYEASTLGRIRSVDRKVPAKKVSCKGQKMSLQGKVLKPSINFHNSNYPTYTVILQKHRRQKCFRVGTLVAETFIPKPDGAVKAAYKNGKYLDCRVENLYWTEHIVYKPRPEKIPTPRIRKPRIIDIKTMKEYPNIQEASRDTGIGVTKIRLSCKSPQKYNRFERIYPCRVADNDITDIDKEFMLSIIGD